MAAESKNIKKQHNGDADDSLRGLINRKPRIKWTHGLHQCFVKAVAQLGGPYEATPKQIVKLMGIQDVNSNHIKSHLQKYRQTMDHIQRIEKENATKASTVMSFEANEGIDRGTASGLHINDDFQIINARKATFGGRRGLHSESKILSQWDHIQSSDYNMEQQVQCTEDRNLIALLEGASETSENQLCHQVNPYEPGSNLLGSVATAVQYASTQSIETYDIMRTGEMKKKKASLYSFVTDSHIDGTEAQQKMHDGLRIGLDNRKGKNIKSSIFPKGEPNTSAEYHNNVSRSGTQKQSDHLQTSKERNFASSDEPFDLNVSADEDEISY